MSIAEEKHRNFQVKQGF